MASSRGFLPALAGLIVLAGCAPDPVPVPAVVAPTPQGYTCAQQIQAAGEYNALPIGSMLIVLVDDYGRERRQLRAVLGLPEPAACPPNAVRN